MRLRTFEEYQAAYEKSIRDPEAFWSEIAAGFDWRKPWKQVLEWNFREPQVKWFLGGSLNITENCLDRHLESQGDKVAYTWESNNPDEASRVITYRELHDQVCRFANVLKRNGASTGDRICIYMPMVPEAAIAMLATAAIGAIWSGCSPDFGDDALYDRFSQIQPKLLIGAEQVRYNGRLHSLSDRLQRLSARLAGHPPLVR